MLTSYLNILIVFMLSGHFHILLDYCSGMESVWQSGGLACFTLFVPAIMAEDVVKWTWGKVKAKAGLGANDLRIVEKLIGFVWTFFALFLIGPVFNYPLQRIKGNPQYVIPWSFFGPNYGRGLTE